jgi:dynamin GTPase
MENLIILAESMQQAASLLADEDAEDASRQAPPTFLNVVAVGNIGAGKSAVLNSLIGHPVLPTGENGATRVPILIELQRDGKGNKRGLAIQVDGRTQSVSASELRHSLQGRLSKWQPSKGRPEEIKLKLISGSGLLPSDVTPSRSTMLNF